MRKLLESNLHYIAALSATISSMQKKLKAGKGTPLKDDGGTGGKDAGKAKGKLQRPDWLVKQIRPRNVKETRDWNGKTWRHCCPESGGKCKGKWVTHPDDKCVGEDFRAKRNPDVRRPGKEPDKKKPKKNLTANLATAPDQLQAALAEAAQRKTAFEF